MIKTNIRNFFHTNRFIIAAFFLPVIIALLALAVNGIYPFGGNQIAVIDMYHQYIPFLSELQEKLKSADSLFYTWNGAGGSNFWNLIAYYGASPLNLLLALFPSKLIMEGATLILLIKIGLSGSFMTVYLRYVNKTCDKATVAFSTLYALCSYVMAYYWCIMWMDAVMLLPLVIVGLNRIIDGKSPVLYTVCLALTVFCNYYTAIMVCIFILFYYPVLYFIKCRALGRKNCIVTTVRSVGYSLLGVAASAVMLLPTYLSMQSTYYISADMPENWLFYEDALDIINQLLPNAELTYRSGLPNLYCGLIVVILLVFYIVSKTISLREKTLNIIFLVFLFFSLNLNKLDFIWHGFHFPNQLPYRYTFVICFILIGMAYRAYLRIDEVKVNTIWTVFAGGIGYYLFAQKLLADEVDDVNLFFYGGIAWLAIYCVTLILYKKGQLRKTLFSFLVVILISAEMLSNTCTSFDKVGNTLKSSYFENWDDIVKLVDFVDDEFARTEMNDNYVLNCPALYHYMGISQFSSSINAGTTELMEDIGIEGEPAKNRFNYNQTNPVTNAILNIKYLIGKNLPIEDDDFKLIKKSGHSRLYENRQPLAMGYMAADQIRTWDCGSDNPFEVLDDYVRAATANTYTKVFDDIGDPVISSSNVKTDSAGGGLIGCAVESTDEKSSVILTYTSQKTQKYYAFVEADNASDITVKKGDKTDDIDIRNDCGSIVNIGVIEEGQSFNITIEYSEGKIGNIRSHVCSLNQSSWDKAYDMLSSDTMDVTEFSDGYVKGTIDVSESGVFVTSIPYDDGWSLKVDGRQRQIDELVGGAFISTALDEGTHEIELSFRPPGFIAGSVITLASIAALILLRFIAGRRSGNVWRKGKAPSAAPDSDQASDDVGDFI